MPRRSRSAPRRRRRSRSGGRRRRERSATSPRSREDECPATQEEPYVLEVLTGRHQDPLPVYDILVDEDTGKVVPHICARMGEGYAIRVSNGSRRHIACAVMVDGENALLRDGSLIVAPGDSRELPGYLVSKNFVGKEYVKEYRDFRFGKPKVVESGATSSSGQAAEQLPYTTYGCITCDVFEAVLDEEVGAEQELRGQTTHYRGSGLNGSFDDREVPEGKKKHFLYSSVTVQGPRSSIANSTKGRWWIRGRNKLRSLEVRYREAHSLMILGVDAAALGLAPCKEEANPDVKAELKDESKKEEDDDTKSEKDEKPGIIQMCDLTNETESELSWTVFEKPPGAEPVDIAT